MISASDKDWKDILGLMFKIATIVIWKSNNKLAGLYDQEEEENLERGLMVAAGIEDQEEFGLLEMIFGVQSSVLYEVFIENMTGPAKWGFDAAHIRKVVFTESSDG